MRKIRIALLVVMALLLFTNLVSAAAPTSKNFVAVLSGENERPVPRETQARGVAVFQLSDDGTVLEYKLIVANIENAFAAHIHCGAVDASGGVGVTLYAAPGTLGSVDGVVATGSVTAPDASAAANCGWTDLGDVVDAMLAGNAYVNVHTNDLVAPTNTGPGDFPGGEIRGQIYEAGASQ